MSVLSGRSLRMRQPFIITPYAVPAQRAFGCSYGETHAGYDIRLAKEVLLVQGHTTLGASLERFQMPKDLQAQVKDKSTLCRMGVKVQNTVIEPGWCGFLTLELTFEPLLTEVKMDYLLRCHRQNPGMSFNAHPTQTKILEAGHPIAQIVFYTLNEEVGGYDGKYQDQGPDAVPAILEGD